MALQAENMSYEELKEIVDGLTCSIESIKINNMSSMINLLNSIYYNAYLWLVYSEIY